MHSENISAEACQCEIWCQNAVETTADWMLEVCGMRWEMGLDQADDDDEDDIYVG